MEGTEKEILIVLLNILKARGLVSEITCSRAVDWVHAWVDIPQLLREPACLTEEECLYEYP